MHTGPVRTYLHPQAPQWLHGTGCSDLRVDHRTNPNHPSKHSLSDIVLWKQLPCTKFTPIAQKPNTIQSARTQQPQPNLWNPSNEAEFGQSIGYQPPPCLRKALYSVRTSAAEGISFVLEKLANWRARRFFDGFVLIQICFREIYLNLNLLPNGNNVYQLNWELDTGI